jgi:hypothetical protein
MFEKSPRCQYPIDDSGKVGTAGRHSEKSAGGPNEK